MNKLKPLEKSRGRLKADIKSRLNCIQDLFVKDLLFNHDMITHR